LSAAVFAVSTIGFVLSDEVGQAFDAEVGDLLLVGAVDSKAGVLWLHVDMALPQQLGILTEHFGGKRDGIDPGDRGHDQAASWRVRRTSRF